MPFPTRVIETRSDVADVFQENNQNILQKTAVSNMIGVLEQLNKISIYASEIFSDILETTETNNKRIKTIKSRLNSIEQRVEPTEQIFINQAPSFFYDNPYTGKEWQRKDPLRGLLFRRDRANKSVNLRRNIGAPLPDLSAMDRISSIPCIKKYSDSNFFMNEWLEAEKKKMEEEKAKRRERKKKRKKRKRQGAEKIAGIERWVYDPITGKKVKKQAAEITVTKYELIGDVNTANMDFESSDKASSDRISGMSKSTVAQMANKKEKKKKQQRAVKKQQAVSNLSANPGHQKGGPSYGAIDVEEVHAAPPSVPGSGGGGGGPPPNPVVAAAAGPPPPNPMGGGPPPNPVQGGPGGPPPVPVPGGGGPGGGPPPNPMAGGGPGAPPPVPVVKKKLTAAEMAMRSAQQAESTGAYQAATVPAAAAKPAAPKRPLHPMKSNALLAGIRGGMQLKKVEVKREKKMDKRDMLLSAIQKKGGKGGLRKVAESEKNVKKEEEKDATIFAILNRRQFMADDSDSDSSGSWEDSD